MSFTYLASPYTHPSTSVMQERYEQALDATAKLLKQGIHVYSPIVHSHPLALQYELPRDHEFWQEYNGAMLEEASRLLVLRLPGWAESRGVCWELEEAARLDLPIEYLTP